MRKDVIILLIFLVFMISCRRQESQSKRARTRGTPTIISIDFAGQEKYAAGYFGMSTGHGSVWVREFGRGDMVINSFDITGKFIIKTVSVYELEKFLREKKGTGVIINE